MTAWSSCDRLVLLDPLGRLGLLAVANRVSGVYLTLVGGAMAVAAAEPLALGAVRRTRRGGRGGHGGRREHGERPTTAN
ncbi:hypothetical protein [Streptomyces sp. NPDC048392]|uniref:hypothetical protein n=1 Tax=Streptomyces sp. NPDC048392 TaxID=3365543 RepID=UPI00372083B6